MCRLPLIAALATLIGCATTPDAPAEAGPPVAEAAVPTDAFRAQPPKPGAPPKLAIPTFQKAVLTNGMTVIVSERHELPLVSVNVAFAAGSGADPKGKG